MKAKLTISTALMIENPVKSQFDQHYSLTINALYKGATFKEKFKGFTESGSNSIVVVN